MYGPVIQGERVTMRPPMRADAAAWERWRAVPEISRFAWRTTQGVPSLAQIERQLAETGDATDRVTWVLERDARPIGLAFIGQIDWVARHGYHGYAIGDPELWGKGIATEASSLAVRFGFETLRLNKIKAEVAAPHVPSQRVLEKVGFRRCGMFREDNYVDGQLTDMIWFELLRDEWRA